MSPPSRAGKVLVIGSSAQVLHLPGGRTVPTGNYLNELVVPMQMLRAAGFELEVATPQGGRPPLDARSVSPSHFGGDEAVMGAALGFYENDPGFRHPRSLQSVLDAGLDDIDGFFVPGGHAPLADLASSLELGRVLRHAHQHAKPIAMLCHGPIASLAALPDPAAFQEALKRGERESAARLARDWPFRDFRMTIFSDSEERPVEANVLGGPLPFSVADALTIAGARVEHGPDYASFVVADRGLVTGQNPRSDRQMASRFIEELLARNTRRMASNPAA